MSNQKSKKRIIRYIVIFETDTDFKEKLFNDFLMTIPISMRAYFPGKPNKIEINKLKI